MGGLARFRARVSWYRGALAYDREMGQHYVFVWTVRADRCAHRSRRLGLQCARIQTYDGFCGLHNSLCAHDGARCDGLYAKA